MAGDFPLINGTPFSWASTAVSFLWTGGVYSTPLLTEINYSHKIDRSKVRGAGSKALGATRGEHDCEGSFKMFASGWDDFRNLLYLSPDAIIAGGKIGVVKFDLLFMQQEGILPPRSVTLSKCQIAEIKGGSKQGTEADEVEVSLLVMDVLENGFSLL